MMQPVDKGPEPSDADLAPFMRDPPISDVEEVVRAFAEMDWRTAMRERDPDAFLVPFADMGFPAAGFKTYRKYLESALWRSIKRQELRKAGGRCAACSKTTDTIHHRDYRPRVLLGEDRTPLIALCARCHDRVHHMEGGRRRNTWDECERVLREMVDARISAQAVSSAK